MWLAHVEVVNELLRNGADIDFQRPSGSTALNIACEHDRSDIVVELVNRGASIDLADMEKNLKPNQPGMEIQIPVKLKFETKNAEATLDIAEAEREIEAQWKRYAQKPEKRCVECGIPRCIVVLQSMSLDLHGLQSTDFDASVAIERVVMANVWFSDLRVNLASDMIDEFDWTKMLRQLVTRIFDTSRR
ncbi:hypothetical protein PI124_g16034 [Phytophthora idaei]|nr:hypothetical protein PI125_g16149 [Phytophthora idaei]KAG3239029.1 hypothetical protein PI124_g16034 [Phytophthora idaei]